MLEVLVWVREGEGDKVGKLALSKGGGGGGIEVAMVKRRRREGAVPYRWE